MNPNFECRGMTEHGVWVFGYYIGAWDNCKPRICGYDREGKCQWWFVAPETVSYWTGMFDRKKKKIFGGDICRIDTEEWSEERLEVKFECGEWCLSRMDGEGGGPLFPYTNRVEVYWNIHE